MSKLNENTTKAYLNDPKVKTKYVNRVKKHQEADEIIQGKYWENGKGCAVGCTIEGSEHARYETELGIPRMIARLEDRIFEGLSNEEAKKFPLKFLKAIKPGADLSMVVPKFFVWILIDPQDGVIKFARPDGKKAIQKVADLYLKKIAGKIVSETQWRVAAYAAYAAYAAADAYAADAAAYAAAAAAYAADAADAADAAAYAADAAYAAAAAAYAADAAYAAADAWKPAKQKYFKKMADKLIELLKAAPQDNGKET